MLVPQGVGAAAFPHRRREQDRQVSASRRIAVTGFAIVAAATVPFAFAGPHTSPWLLALWMVIRGFGLGAVTMPVMVAGYIGLDKQQIPHSSVLTRTTQQIGGSFGTAVLAVILEGAIAAHHGAPPTRSTSRSGGPPASPPSPCCSPCGCPAARGPLAAAPAGPPVRLSSWMDRRPATSTPPPGPAPTSSPEERA